MSFVEIPLISVRLITYNHFAYIQQAIDSILAQKTTFSYEIVIGDDTSTDGTQEILREYADRYPDKIKLLLQEKNLGGRHNLFQTLQACTGKYVAFLDGDDYWIDEYKLQKQVSFLEQNPDYALSFHNTQVVLEYEQQRTYLSNAHEERELTTENILLDGWVMMTASLVMRNPNPLPSWVMHPTNRNIDYTLQLLLSLVGKIHYSTEVMAVYWIHAKSISRNFKKLEWEKSHWHIFKHFDQLTHNQYKKLTDRRRVEVCLKVLHKFPTFSLTFWRYFFQYWRFQRKFSIDNLKTLLIIGFIPPALYRRWNKDKDK
jgi:glycosyltransferase involved in cell wall biosynthesis